MNRRILLTALAGCLALPALASAQIERSRIPVNANPPWASATEPAYLPDPTPSVPKPLPKDVIPEKAPAAASIALPPRSVPQPAATLEKPSSDPRGTSLSASAPGQTGSSCYGDGAAGYGLTDAGHSSSLWIVPEYLLWKTTGMHVPILATSSPAGIDRAQVGVLGDPNTSVLFGGQTQLNGFHSGLRLRAGFWCDNTQTLGVDAGFFYLSQQSRQETFSSGGEIGLARPFFDVTQGLPSAEPIAFSTVNTDGSLSPALTGALLTRTTTDLWGADVNLRRFLYESDGFRLDGLLGYRYQRLRDTVETISNSTVQSSAALIDLPIGSTIRIHDMFETTNNFNGGQVGLAGQWCGDRWTFGLNGKIALGVNSREVRINGLTTIGVPGSAPVTLPGGLLAQPSINGRYRSNDFSVIPELGFNLGYQLTTGIRMFAGYSFMYWNNVVRAGDQIDASVNPSQAPRSLAPATLVGAARPTLIQQDASFWVQGVNLGFEFRW